MFTLEQAMNAQTESRGIPLPFLYPQRQMGVSVQRHAPAALPPEGPPVPTLQEAGSALRPVWTGAENLASTRFRPPNRPACRQSPYRLSYTGRQDYYRYIIVTLYVKDSHSCRGAHVVKGTPRFSWNLQIHRSVHNSLYLDPVLRQLNPIHPLAPIHYIFILTSTTISPKLPFAFRFLG